jgi:pilus assembly protein Flp/PilA
MAGIGAPTGRGLQDRQTVWEQTVQNLVARFIADDTGATAIEYGLVASLISIALISTATILGGNVSKTYDNIGKNVKAVR